MGLLVVNKTFLEDYELIREFSNKSCGWGVCVIPAFLFYSIIDSSSYNTAVVRFLLAKLFASEG